MFKETTSGCRYHYGTSRRLHSGVLAAWSNDLKETSQMFLEQNKGDACTTQWIHWMPVTAQSKMHYFILCDFHLIKTVTENEKYPRIFFQRRQHTPHIVYI